MRSLLVASFLALSSCGGASSLAGEGDIVITYRAHGDFVDDVMAYAENLLPELSRKVRLEPTEDRPRLDVRISKDGYTRGRAEVCGLSGWVEITPVNKDGEDRFLYGAYAAAHEIGHMLGATHSEETDYYSIMNYGVLYYLNYRPKFTAESIQQIEACIG